MDWRERYERAAARYEGGEARELDERQLVQLANAAWAAGLSLLMDGDREGAREWLVRAASRYRETLLYDIYLMGKRSIERGSRDSWTIHPQVIEAFREDGQRWRSLRNPSLQTLHAQLPKRQRVERLVQWHVEGVPLCLRLMLSWNRRTKSFGYFLTTLPSQQDPLAVLCRAYKWRWHVELLRLPRI